MVKISCEVIFFLLLLLFKNVDIDECKLGRQHLGHNCPEKSQCINLPGSEGRFDCRCSPGFSMVVGPNNQVRRCMGKQCMLNVVPGGVILTLSPPSFLCFLHSELDEEAWEQGYAICMLAYKMAHLHLSVHATCRYTLALECPRYV